MIVCMGLMAILLGFVQGGAHTNPGTIDVQRKYRYDYILGSSGHSPKQAQSVSNSAHANDIVILIARPDRYPDLFPKGLSRAELREKAVKPKHSDPRGSNVYHPKRIPSSRMRAIGWSALWVMYVGGLRA